MLTGTNYGIDTAKLPDEFVVRGLCHGTFLHSPLSPIYRERLVLFLSNCLSVTIKQIYSQLHFVRFSSVNAIVAMNFSQK